MSKRTLTKMSDFRDRVIENAVKSAHEFGYSLVNKENILTDEVYKLYFASILKQTIREVPNEIIQERIEENSQRGRSMKQINGFTPEAKRKQKE